MEALRRLLAAGVAVVLVACQPGASTPPASASPVGVDGDQLIATFLELVTADGFTANTEITGSLTAGALQAAIQVTGSLSGGDGTMTFKLNTVSDTIEFEAIFVGEYGYVRLPREDWQRLPREQVNTSGAQLDSFEFLTTADDLRYEGTTTHDGGEVHVLVNARPLELDRGSSASPQNRSGDMTKLRILVLSDGTPVFLSYHMNAIVEDTIGGKVSVMGDIEQSFTDVGQPVVIEPPASFTD